MTTYHIFYSPNSETSALIIYDDLSLQEAKSIFIPLLSTVRLIGGDVRLLDDNLHTVASWGCRFDRDQVPQEWEAEIANLHRRTELVPD